MQWKLFTAGVTLCAAAGVGLFADYLGARQAAAAQLRAEAELSQAEMLPRTPAEVLRGLYTQIGYAVGHGGAEPACGLMTPPARQEFADAYGQPDCPAAARMLGAQVRNHNRYPLWRYDADQDEVINGDEGSMDGCAVVWRDALDPPDFQDPGPKLGRLTLHRLLGLGFQITGYVPCGPAGQPPTSDGVSSTVTPSTSPPTAPTSPPTPPTTSAPALGLLPSYAPSLPKILAGRIAANDPGTCGELFTDEARHQFAAAHQAADCPAAVTAMHAQVTDPELYADPQGATETPGPAGRTVVDGCHLTWSTWSGDAHPGPQVGRLTLEHPARNPGYVISGYQPC